MPTIRYLALGDSYTIGESVPAEERWPDQLARLLAADREGSLWDGIQIDLTLIARTGWTVKELWEGIQADPPQGTYDLVTLLIGVNDQYRGYPLDGYRKDFRFLLGKAIEYASRNPRKVIVLSIPDWSVTPFARDHNPAQVAKEIGDFNAVNQEEAEKVGVYYVDITSISRQAVSDATLIASDGLHPSGKMYTLWAQEVFPVASEILKGFTTKEEDY